MHIFVFLLLIVFLSSCHVSSKTALDGSGGRSSYNESLQMTNNEQMLLNLIRLRYLDTPFFLDVSNITTQFTYRTSATPILPIPGFTSRNPFSLGGEFSWQNQPTVQYTPLEGHAFATQLLRPIELKTLQQLILSGWDIDLVFRLAIQSFDELSNAPEASAPIPEYVPNYKAFFEVTSLLHYFQRRSQLMVGVVRQETKEKGDHYSLQLAFPETGEEAEKLSNLLSNVNASHGRYVLNLEFGFNQTGRIGILPRSILSCMYYLSNSVDVPAADIRNGVVPRTKSDEEGEYFDWAQVIGTLMKVCCSPLEPTKAYVAVKYRGYWFYIDDTDLISKKTFVLLLQLYSLQSQEAKNVGPVLTLPLGI